VADSNNLKHSISYPSNCTYVFLLGFAEENLLEISLNNEQAQVSQNPGKRKKKKLYCTELNFLCSCFSKKPLILT